MGSFSPPTGVPPHIHAARRYISMWFVDLYGSNREAVKDLSAFTERYQAQLFCVSNEYDHYLTLLNASIRPTYIKHHIDHALYIPVIVDCINVNDKKNPFGINNFALEKELSYGLTQIMKSRNLWDFSQLSSDPMGRPCWLFNWHDEDCACFWFTPKDNHVSDDVTIAYILGTACTQNLGYRNVDEWQYFIEGVVPQNPNPLDYHRVLERCYYGSYEFRTMEIDTDFSLTRFLADANCTILGEEGEEDEQLMSTCCSENG